MTQSKPAKAAPERRCVLTKSTEPAVNLVRLVLGPDGTLVPDVAARLPGRGVWISADGARIEAAVTDGSLIKAAARSLKTGLTKEAVPQGFVEMIDGLLVRRVLDRLGLEQRAGNLVTGFDKIKAALGKKSAGEPALIVAATDGAEDGQKKLKAAVGAQVPVAKLFDREALSKALGRENVVHLVLFTSGGTEKLMADIGRLLSLRGMPPLTFEAQGNEE
jgi:predicted RNA-binding protein YlxR (DUF448 family)/ribosomal protein L7Ae-like RNA K-turn-binding protein